MPQSQVHQPKTGDRQTGRAAAWQTRRRPGWHYLLAALLLAPMVLLGSHRVIGRTGLATPYSVSVAVRLEASDPQMWAVASADDFAAAQAIDGELPDPMLLPALGEAGAATGPLNVNSLLQEAYAGPAAQRHIFRGRTSTDTARAHYCLTATLYYEAASESDDGMRGVAQVVLNRVRHPSFPGSVCGVVFQGSQRAIVCQFTFSCDGAMARAPSRPNWQRASRIAAEALAGRTFPAVGLATHYHTLAVWPSWGRSLAMTNVIGAHIFHRWRGRWGTPSAFSRPYAGVEPVPGPYLPIAQQLAARAGRTSPALTPLPTATAASLVSAPAGQIDAATMAAMRNAPIGTAAATPATAAPGFTSTPVVPRPDARYTDSRLAGSGTIREEFRNSGAPVNR